MQSHQSSPDAVVLDGAQRSALAAVRSLGRHSLRIAVAETHHPTLASQSKYCSERLLCPSPDSEPHKYIDWLFELGERWPGQFVLPITDFSVPATLSAIDRGAAIRSPLPPRISYEAATDKFRCTQLALESGLHAPRTKLIGRADLPNLDATDFLFPVVVKPRQSAHAGASGLVRRNVSYAKNAQELFSQCRENLLDESDRLLLQEHISGYGAGVFALYDHGKPLLFFSHRRVREKPPSGGVSVLSESTTLHPDLRRSVEKLLTGLNWHGVAMVELKIPDDGLPTIMEINARLWGSLQLAIDCGVDFPYLLERIVNEQPFRLPSGYPAGRRLRWLLGDLDNLYLTLRDKSTTVHSKLQAVAHFMVPWRPGLRYELLRFNDPRPAWFAARQYIADLAR